MRTCIYSVQILPDGSEHRFMVAKVVCDPGGKPKPIPIGFASEYDQVMAHVPDGMAWRDRDPRDPPEVVETWEWPEENEEASRVDRDA